MSVKLGEMSLNLIGVVTLITTLMLNQCESRFPPDLDPIGSALDPDTFIFPQYLPVLPERCHDSNAFGRDSFPRDFVFGTASSAYQYEGAANGQGRGFTLWDEYSHRHSERISDGSSGDVAVDFYNTYKDDIKLMKDMNMDAFRFSFSWTRIFPHGRRSKGINQKGVDFYNDLINELIKNGIKPFATLFHWENPLVFEAEYGGFLEPRIVEDFRDFAAFCFEAYGDRVDNWGTFNEPWVYSVAGYDKGKKAPGRCSQWVNNTCLDGDSGTEPYIVSHHQILAHVAAVKEFRKCKQCMKRGAKIGIVVVGPWLEPYDDNSEEDKKAVRRSLEFVYGWFLKPLVYGDYPETMKRIVKNRLPKFTESEKLDLVMYQSDYLGLNYYGSFYGAHMDHVDPTKVSYTTDQRTEWKASSKHSNSASSQNTSTMFTYPIGFRRLLRYLKHEYRDPEMYIMENGLAGENNETKPLPDCLQDTERQQYLQNHVFNLEKAICEDKVRVKGYMIWSLLDNYEWQIGYKVRFGLYYVDYKDGLKRYPKSSALWLKGFLNRDIPHFTGLAKAHPFVDFIEPLDKYLLKTPVPSVGDM